METTEKKPVHKKEFSRKEIGDLIQHIIEVRTKRYNKLRKDGASADLSISFMIGANTVLTQLQYLYENGEIKSDESSMDS